MRIKLADVAVALAATLILLAPALWNGFPLVEHDTGGYLARWFEGTLEVSRSTVYGLFLNALTRPDFWPAVIVQAGLTVWVLALVLRAHKLGHRPLVLLVTVALLSVATTLNWLTSILLTDIFAGLGVLALYLLVLHAGTLMRWERAALVVLAGFCAATHSATLAVMLGLLVAAALVALLHRRLGATAELVPVGSLVPMGGIGRGAAALALGPVMLLAANYVVAGQLAWTPGGIALSFGRMLQDGIVARYLAFFPRQTYPVRTGVHSSTAFGFALALDHARAVGHRELEALIVERSLAYYAADRDAPAAWEPSGDDFLSPSLIEADLMRRVLAPAEFPAWLHAFLPRGLPPSLQHPAIVSDRSDGKLAHLDGLNLSRAWCLRAVAAALPAGDPLVPQLAASADAHAAAGMAHVATGDYMGEHWLASFAVYLLGTASR